MYTLRTLPGDDVRQIMWRFADRFDLQMSVQSARSIARSTVAKLVAEARATPMNGPTRKTNCFPHSISQA